MPLPPAICDEPEGPADTRRPDHVVGNGTPASCDESALRAAVAAGGTIVFDCGPDPVAVKLVKPLAAPGNRDTVLDGKHRIALDGGGVTQLLRAERLGFRDNHARLTVQRMTLQNGRDPGTDFRPRKPGEACAWGYRRGGGGAIYVRNVNLRVWGVAFIGNRGPELGPDVAGGAVYARNAKEMTVVRSLFLDNRAANGGAIGALNTSARLLNLVIDDNRATGIEANFSDARKADGSPCPTFNHPAQGGAGGLGGGFYADGEDLGDSLCGVRMAGNESRNLGGAVFRSAYGGQRFDWDRCAFRNNRSTTGGGGAVFVNNSTLTLSETMFENNDGAAGDGGGMKLDKVTLRASGVSFIRNRAALGGGLAHWGAGPEGYGDGENMIFSANAPDDRAGDRPIGKGEAMPTRNPP